MKFKLLVYYGILCVIAVLGIVRWKYFKRPEKIISLLIFCTIVSEGIAAYCVYRWHNNNPVYHVYTPIEFLLISLYFDEVIPFFRKRRLGLILGICGIFVSLADTLFLQPFYTTDSYFILLEATVVIVYCLLALREVLLDEDLLPYGCSSFWITICFLVYWSATFTVWGLDAMMTVPDYSANPIYGNVVTFANYIFYLGIAAIFFFFKKLKPPCA